MHGLSHLTVTRSLRSKSSYPLHFAVEELRARDTECVAQRPTISNKQNLGLNSGQSDYMFSFLIIILSNFPDEGTGSGQQRGRSGEEAAKEAITFFDSPPPFHLPPSTLLSHLSSVFENWDKSKDQLHGPTSCFHPQTL